MRKICGTASYTIRNRSLGPVVIPCPLCESTWRTRIAQVQWATHPRFDKPALRGDGGIAPPVMVPELRFRLTTGLHRQIAAAGIRIMQERYCLGRGFVIPRMAQLKMPLYNCQRSSVCVCEWVYEGTGEVGGHYFNVVSKDKKRCKMASRNKPLFEAWAVWF